MRKWYLFVFIMIFIFSCGVPQEKIDHKELEQRKVKFGKIKQSLAGCSGYWGHYRKSVAARYRPSWWSKANYWSPNCYMDAPGKDCGDGDDDHMVSFWMGPDYTLDSSKYRRSSTSYWGRVWLRLRGSGVSTRIYTQTINGITYGNAYTCIPKWIDASTIRLIKLR